jgi:hypothetical protein
MSSTVRCASKNLNASSPQSPTSPLRHEPSPSPLAADRPLCHTRFAFSSCILAAFHCRSPVHLCLTRFPSRLLPLVGHHSPIPRPSRLSHSCLSPSPSLPSVLPQTSRIFGADIFTLSALPGASPRDATSATLLMNLKVVFCQLNSRE